MNTIKNAFVFSVITLGLLCGFASTANAGCRINYSIQNSSNENVYVRNLEVKSKGGAWKKLRMDMAPSGSDYKSRLNPKQKYRDYFNTTFGCKTKRRYRFTVMTLVDRFTPKCTKTIYYPSVSSWTPKNTTDIDFGDVSRHCK